MGTLELPMEKGKAGNWEAAGSREGWGVKRKGSVAEQGPKVPSQDSPSSSFLLLTEKLQSARLSLSSKEKINQKSGTMQKQKKTVKQDKIITG